MRSRALVSLLAIAASTLSAAAGTLSAAASARAALPVRYGASAIAAAAAGADFSPDSVAGANVACRPTLTHPDPVVLVHGTTADEASNWVTLAPLLANNGYCVYAFNYGSTWLSLGDRIDGLGEISSSAAQLAAFVNAVLAQTGAAQVDIVGHSQGGMMPLYYLKFLGGAAKVNTLIGLSPSNHGTTLSGLVTLLNHIPWAPAFGGFILDLGSPAFAEQEAGSPFMVKLFAGGDTVPGPRYVVIQTAHDEVVTPYANAFLNGPGVTNLTVQQQCPDDPVGHIGMFEDSPALQNVLNQLTPSPERAFRASCTRYGAGF